jgi:hypothetical protein
MNYSHMINTMVLYILQYICVRFNGFPNIFLVEASNNWLRQNHNFFSSIPNPIDTVDGL